MGSLLIGFIYRDPGYSTRKSLHFVYIDKIVATSNTYQLKSHHWTTEQRFFSFNHRVKKVRGNAVEIKPTASPQRFFGG